MWYSYKPYVSVAKRRDQAAREISQRRKKGQTLSPIAIEGRNITTTFWGQAWCNHLESYSDYANRLPRGRSYVRNGFVIDLQIEKGKISALVSGSEVYKIEINIAALPTPAWQSLKQKSAGQIGSLVELLQGKLSKSVMELVVDRDKGLFPKPKEIKMRCSCPDYVGMCKHLAAVLYGIGSRFDTSPELLFLLRGVDHTELIEQAIPAAPAESIGNVPTLASEDLGAIFGIELGDDPVAPAAPASRKKPAAKSSASQPAKKAVERRVATKAASSDMPSAKKTATKAPTGKKSTAPKKSAASRKAPALKKPPAASQKKATSVGAKHKAK